MTDTTPNGNEQDAIQVLHAGAQLEDADAAVLLVHGRGATAESIMGLGRMLNEGTEKQVAWLAPQAPGNTWYPQPFMEPIESNEPSRTNALVLIDGLIGAIQKAGISQERIGVIGFSQGACLSLEHSAVGDNLPAFVGALSGGVMGPEAEGRTIDGTRANQRIFIGCGDNDSHIPIERAEQSATIFANAGAAVDFRRYEGMEHIINDDEMAALKDEIAQLAS